MSYTWNISQINDPNWTTVANWKDSLDQPAGLYPNSSSHTANLTTNYTGLTYNLNLDTNVTLNTLSLNKTTGGYADLKITTSNSSALSFTGTTCSITCTSFTDSTTVLDCSLNITCTTLNITVPTDTTLKITGTLTGPSTTTINVSGGGTLIFEKDALFSGKFTNASGTTLMLGNHTSEGIIGNRWKVVSAGASHFAAIRHDNTLWTWGLNTATTTSTTIVGQCSRNNITYYQRPVMVTIAGQNGGADNDWSQVACGDSYTIAIKTDGTMWSCGSNTYNSLGRTVNASNLASILCKIGTDTNWKYVAVSGNISSYCTNIALKTDGTLWVWGSSSVGSLGLGATTSASTPTKIPAPTALTNESPAPLDNDWSMVSIGGSGSNGQRVLAIKTDGTLWAWGNNTFGSPGVLGVINTSNISVTDTTSSFINTPRRVGTGSQIWSSPPATGFGGVLNSSWKFSSIAAGLEACYAVDTSGRLWSWGRNTSNALGISVSTSTVQSYPVQVGSETNWLKVTAPRTLASAFAIDTNGNAWGCGLNTGGILGLGDTSLKTVFTKQSTNISFSDISANGTTILGLTSDGYISSWGNNTSISSFYNGVDVQKPYLIPNTWKKISGYDVCLGLDTSNKLWVWGKGTSGQLGIGNSFTYKRSPFRITGEWLDIASGTGACYSIKYVKTVGGVNCGSIYSWGDSTNTGGQLGRVVNSNNLIPVIVGTADNWTRIYARINSVYAINTDNELWAWGINTSGELGIGSIINASIPTQVNASGITWKKVATYTGFTIGITTDGKLYSWGTSGSLNLTGQQKTAPGTTSVTNNLPTLLNAPDSNSEWIDIAVGIQYVLAVIKNNTTNVSSIYAWGNNTYGQLGNGNNTNVTMFPTSANCGTSKTDWVKVYASGSISAAVDINGKLWMWGQNNGSRVLASNDDLNKNIPQLAHSDIDITCNYLEITSALNDYGCYSIDSSGNSYVWGVNTSSARLLYQSISTSYIPSPVSTNNETEIENNGTLIIDTINSKLITSKITGTGSIEYRGGGNCVLSRLGTKCTQANITSGKLNISMTNYNAKTINVSIGAKCILSQDNADVFFSFTKTGGGDLVVPYGISMFDNIITHNGGNIIVGDSFFGTGTVNCIDSSTVLAITNTTANEICSLTLNNGSLQISYPNTIVEITGNTGSSATYNISNYTINNSSLDYGGSGVNVTLPTSFSGSVKKSNGGTIRATGTYTNPVTIESGTLNVTGSFTNTLTAGSGSSITGTGTITDLSINQGATVASTLVISTATLNTGVVMKSALNANIINVASGAAIGGTVTYKKVNVDSGAKLVPGNSPGLLVISNGLTLNAGSIFEWELTDNTSASGDRGVKYDAVNVTGGDLIIQPGATMKLLLEPNVDYTNSFWNADTSWNVFNVTSGNITGSFDPITTSSVVYTGVGTPSNDFTNSFDTAKSGGNLNLTYTKYTPPVTNSGGSLLTTQNAKATEFVMAGALNDDTKTALKDDGYSLVNVGDSYLGGAVTVKSQALSNQQVQVDINKGNLDVTGNINMVPVDETDALTREYYTYFGSLWRLKGDSSTLSYERDNNGTWVAVHVMRKS